MAVAMDNIVSLNVGGKKFTSSRDTICKVRPPRNRQNNPAESRGIALSVRMLSADGLLE
jgi:hypothetical protein